MNKGDMVYTPRFLSVRIKEVLTGEQAREKGYQEPTYYRDPDYDVFGKHIGLNLMVFAAVKKEA